MKYLYAPLAGLFVTLTSLMCPVLVLLALPFIRWDDHETPGGYGDNPVIRGSLPGWLSWLETPDERLPGGLYEDAHRELYEKHGKWLASWMWIGVRNRLHGLAHALGKPTTGYVPIGIGLGLWERDDVWQYTAQLGPFRFVMGYQIYKLLDDTFSAVPVFSIKLRPV